MNRTPAIKIVIPLLLALAIALGLIQRSQDPYLNKQTIINHSADNKSLLSYSEQAQVLAQSKSSTTTASFLATGDIMLSRNVAAAISSNPISHGKYSIGLPFRPMENILSSTDFNFANLESPFDPAFKGTIGGHSMVFSAPSNYIAGLTDFNFKIVNLANNHAFDLGLNGLNFTRQSLELNNIRHEGTGDNLDEAWQPAEVFANGINICFIGASYASVNDGGKTKNDFVARIEDLDRLNKSITEAKSECDFTVVTMHAGVEYTRTPNEAQIKFAHTAIDGGADMVIGAHPHWVQTIEKYQNKYIFYSLGNFIFDQMFSRDTREGLTLKITVSKSTCHPDPTSMHPKGAEGSLNNSHLRDSSAALGMTNNGECADDLQGSRQSAKLDSIELFPVIIENYSTPRPATAEETKNILNKIGQTESILK